MANRLNGQHPNPCKNQRLIYTTTMNTNLSPLNERAIFDIALGIDNLQDIASRHDFTPKELKTLVARPEIRKLLDAKRRELESTGVTFRSKCVVLADELLVSVFNKACDPDTRLDVKADVLKKLVEWGELGPKKEEQPLQSLPMVNINIGSDGSQTISVQPGQPDAAPSPVEIQGSPQHSDPPDYLRQPFQLQNPLTAGLPDE